MNTPLLIIGFGSIGKRHYRNLSLLGYDNISVFDPSEEAFSDFSGVKRLKKIDQAELKNFKVSFICSPNDCHIKHALSCTKTGHHIFIEKPLSHNLSGIKRLERIVRNKSLTNMVACNRRFHPCLSFIKDFLDQNGLGKIYSIHHEFGYYLPYWRPEQDYRKNYAAKKMKGGGVILDDIHEFDLLFWLNDFSPVIDSKFIYEKVSDLEIETEDICIAGFKFKNKVLGSVRCDYLQKRENINCKIVGEKGDLEWNIAENIVWLKNGKGSENLFHLETYDSNGNYLTQLKYFFECIKKGTETFNNISTAHQILKFCIRR